MDAIHFQISFRELLLNEDASWNKQSVIGRLFVADNRPADNRPKHYRCTSIFNRSVANRMFDVTWQQVLFSVQFCFMSTCEFTLVYFGGHGHYSPPQPPCQIWNMPLLICISVPQNWTYAIPTSKCNWRTGWLHFWLNFRWAKVRSKYLLKPKSEVISLSEVLRATVWSKYILRPKFSWTVV